MKVLPTILVAMLGTCSLVACQNISTVASATSTRSGHGHPYPLGLGQTADSQAAAVAYLVLGAPEVETKRSEVACKALFDELNSQPQSDRGSPYMVTHLPLQRVGDFSRTSGRFNRGLCAHLASVQDRTWLKTLHEEMGYSHTRGPHLLVLPQQQGQRLSLDQAIVVDLSLVRDDDLTRTIHNWRSEVMPKPVLWYEQIDLAGLYQALSKGLSQVEVVQLGNESAGAGRVAAVP